MLLTPELHRTGVIQQGRETIKDYNILILFAFIALRVQQKKQFACNSENYPEGKLCLLTSVQNAPRSKILSSGMPWRSVNL
ncbi:MAG: hypothetical protein COX20_05815 [Desulfobacterales bacterium CG23_combo_of_CG06-09_8_20_14_all_52_9]|nr:MAG: hypothetical protein COX20_05815 [Desulfobacterales bacterium CG23_combo_of_CG06-09_8_20_14_all_52_9]